MKVETNRFLALRKRCRRRDSVPLEAKIVVLEGWLTFKNQQRVSAGSPPRVTSTPSASPFGLSTVLPIVEHIARTQPQRTVIVAHADRRAQDHALRETVLHLGREIDDFTSYAWYESVDDGDTRSRHGFMDLTDIPLPDDIQVFTCGPLPFMRHVRSTLLSRGVPPARIRYEVFGPDLWAAQTASDSGT